MSLLSEDRSHGRRLAGGAGEKHIPPCFQVFSNLPVYFVVQPALDILGIPHPVAARAVIRPDMTDFEVLTEIHSVDDTAPGQHCVRERRKSPAGGGMKEHFRVLMLCHEKPGFFLLPNRLRISDRADAKTCSAVDALITVHHRDGKTFLVCLHPHRILRTDKPAGAAAGAFLSVLKQFYHDEPLSQILFFFHDNTVWSLCNCFRAIACGACESFRVA